MWSIPLKKAVGMSLCWFGDEEEGSEGNVYLYFSVFIRHSTEASCDVRQFAMVSSGVLPLV